MTLWTKRNFGPPNPPTKTWVLLSGLVNSLHDECQRGWYLFGSETKQKNPTAGGFIKAFVYFAFPVETWSNLTNAPIFFKWVGSSTHFRNPGKGHGFSCLLLWWPFRLTGGRVLGSSISLGGVSRCQGVEKKQERDQNLQFKMRWLRWFLGGGNSHIFIFSPLITWGRFESILTSIFFKGVETATTNSICRWRFSKYIWKEDVGDFQSLKASYFMEGNLMIFTDDVPKGVKKSERIGMFFP